MWLLSAHTAGDEPSGIGSKTRRRPRAVRGLAHGAAITLLATLLAVTAPTPLGAQDPLVDYDSDNDGLIEIDNLAQLNAVRWDLNADGTPDNSSHTASYAAAYPNAADDMGCPSDGCDGYELDADLDFDSDSDGDVDAADHSGAYWNAGRGWDPIHLDGFTYRRKFQGNGHTISNLYIDEPDGGDDSFGLFGELAANALVSGLVLADVDITVVGDKPDVGALVGTSRAPVVRVGVTGTVTGTGDQGTTGGIIGTYKGSGDHFIENYSAASVTGNNDVGGLVGRAKNLDVSRSYSTGPVANLNNDAPGHRVGGLIGYAEASTVEYSYSTSPVTAPWQPSTDVGGLIGSMNGGTISESYATGTIKYATFTDFQGNLGGLVGAATNSAVVDADVYWDGVSTGASSSSGGGTLKTTSQMQSDTEAVVKASGYTGIYSTWTDSLWHFGNEIEYPALVVDFNIDQSSTWTEFGTQRDTSAPSAANPIADQTIGVTGKVVIDVEPTGAEVFDVGTQGALTYTVSTSNATVATAALDSTGKVVTVTGVAVGTADVSVVATDYYGQTGTEPPLW